VTLWVDTVSGLCGCVRVGVGYVSRYAWMAAGCVQVYMNVHRVHVRCGCPGMHGWLLAVWVYILVCLGVCG
jgi:hypothetical protein